MIRGKRGDKVSIKMVIIFSIVTMFIALSNTTQAQTQYNGEEVFVVADEMPSLPGGEKSLTESLSKNLKYPVAAMEKGVEGKVFVKFIITKDGSIANVTVTRSVDPDLDHEAVRVVKMLPKFHPAKKGGKPVNVWYSLPISFQLS